MKSPRAYRSRFGFQSIRAAPMKSPLNKYRKRRALSTIENLENLSFNTRRFLSRNWIQKLIHDEGKTRKSTRSGKRRHSGCSTVSWPNANSSPVAVSERTSLSDAGDTSMLEKDDSVRKDDEGFVDDRSLNGSESATQDEEDYKVSKLESLSPVSFDSCLESEHDLKVSIKFDACKLRTRQKCKFCRESELVNYSGPPTDSKTEADVLDLEDLKVSLEEEEEEEGEDEKPQYRLTEYSVFDEAGHLCPFDGDLIQNNVLLFFSGFVKPVYDDDPNTTGGHPCKEMGPITEWWIAGLDGSDENEKVIVGFSSDRADYYLLRPTTEYLPFTRSINEKTRVTKIVFQFLLSKAADDEKSYEKLLEYLEPQGVSEETLLEFANFIYEQTVSYDSQADADEKHLLGSQCMRQLAESAGIESTKKLRILRKHKVRPPKKDARFTKATITSLVQNCFQPIFTDQMNTSKPEVEFEIRPCEVRLIRLENLHRYAGYWKAKTKVKDEEDETVSRIVSDALEKDIIQPCTVRLQPLSADVLEKYSQLRSQMKRNGRDLSSRLKRKASSDGDTSEDEFVYVAKKKRKFYDSRVEWIGEGEDIENRTQFTCAKVDNERLIRTGNFVTMKYDHRIGLVKYMYEDGNGRMLGHLQWFWKNCETILSGSGSNQELFATDECEDISLLEVDQVVEVDRLSLSVEEWRERGNFVTIEWLKKNRKVANKYYYQKRYDPKIGKFQDLQDDIGDLNTCASCVRKVESEQWELPRPIGAMVYDDDTEQSIIHRVRWRGEDFCVGSCVFLEPGSLIKREHAVKECRKEEPYDEILYPEKYRKNTTQEKESSEEPFDVGMITKMFTKRCSVKRSKDLHIEVRTFFRPEDTHLRREETEQEDLNKLFWSDRKCVLRFEKVAGKCFVSYLKNVHTTIEEWSDRGPYRFYFSESYDNKNKCFTEPPQSAWNVGNVEADAENANVPHDWPVVEPLASMDVFAGCGGLTEGLHQSGVAECRWAIEIIAEPAEAFKLNYPKAKVYKADCNDLLERMLNPKTEDDRQLPKRGDVDLLCGGPPCQGFSRMNRFKDGSYSQFKNSLVTTFLSYCDHFRPRFFIMENVRDFISTNKNLVFKYTMGCLVQMGYQVGFGVLQCGMYGIPQSRRRTIILAAAPGEILPQLPEPTHTFPKSTFLDVNVGDRKYKCGLKWLKSAPYRTITVGDAISDLPKIENNSVKSRMYYKKEAQTHFQKMARGVNAEAKHELRDHVCKKLAPIILKRISYIPREPPGDWRDLPNIEVELPDGTLVKKLKYTHNDWKHPKSPKGQLRGVCICATRRGGKCKEDKKWKQSNTLIPWCLPHTSNRHNNWSGLYGRIPKDSYFRTVVTNPEPMGKQGRVLHPEQDRVVSVRECARSQGFKDSFLFYGDLIDKYKQIGNAVAPPLGRAIGHEIAKCL